MPLYAHNGLPLDSIARYHYHPKVWRGLKAPHLGVQIRDSYEEFTRLAETRPAQHNLNYITLD